MYIFILNKTSPFPKLSVLKISYGEGSHPGPYVTPRSGFKIHHI